MEISNTLHSITKIIYDVKFCSSFRQKSIFNFFLFNTFLHSHCKSIENSYNGNNWQKNVTNFQVEPVEIRPMVVFTNNFIHLFWGNHHNRFHGCAEITIFTLDFASTAQSCEHLTWLSLWSQKELGNLVHFQFLFQFT